MHLRVFGMDVMLPTQEITEDEIRMLVDVGEDKGAIESRARDDQNVLSSTT